MTSFVSILHQAETTVAIKKAEHEQKAIFMHKLKELGVDMTKYTLSLIPDSAVEKEVVVGPTSTTSKKRV